MARIAHHAPVKQLETPPQARAVGTAGGVAAIASAVEIERAEYTEAGCRGAARPMGCALIAELADPARNGLAGRDQSSRMADIAEVLWRDYLKHNPAHPQWVNRDRFVLSNGHASMLLYSLLHLSGYSLSIDDLRAFRQLGSRTAGHPEREAHPGIETTTGPLGQGIANAVGMALAEKLLATKFNRPGHEIIDHRTWVFLGDGCLMEGISHEVCSLAGTLRLGKLVAFFDDNGGSNIG